MAGAVRFDEGFAAGLEPAWAPLAGARLAWRPDPRAGFVVEGWGSGIEAPEGDRTVWAAGAHLVATPWAERRWPVEPALHFGIEVVRADDGEDRSVAFVGGVGVRRPLGARWVLDLTVRNHFLTVDGSPVEDVETGRGVTLWEVAAGIGFGLGR